ncbi:MAG: hypothetical protein NXI10_00515 [bacterium]|nr:hypothetical protein [bacterium]
MRKKLAIIFALALLFAAVLIVRPWESVGKDMPRFFDRLPDADIIGKTDLLKLSESLEQTTYHYRIPFREFLTREFILLQSKSFGVDVQKPVYFFANESDWELRDYGAMFHVKDSSLITKGIKRLSSVIKLSDTLIYDQKIYRNSAAQISIAYGDNWLLVYCGEDFKRTYHDVLFAKRNEIPPNWRAFLNQTKMEGTPLVAKWSSKDLDGYGLNAVDVCLANDSSSITLLSQIHQNDSIAIRLLDSGPTYPKQEFTKTLANLHMDISGLKDHPNDPLVLIMKQIAQKISFPLQDFLTAWQGSVAFRQGGLQSYSEKYIESELDENFNVTEVVKYKTIKLPGFSLFLGMNENYPDFLNRLKIKGILTKPDKRYRLLFSPPLALQKEESSITLHTATYYEKPDTSSVNSVMFTYNKTPYTVHLDSLGTNTYYCRLHIPLNHLVQSNITTDEF